MCGQAPQTSVLHLSSIQTPAVEGPLGLPKIPLGICAISLLLNLLVLNAGNGWVAGVAGMMKLLVMTGIIPENSLRKTHQ